MNSQATKLVRALYIFECRLWDFRNSLGISDGAAPIDTQYLPGRYWDGDRTRKSRWPKIAERLQEQAIDPFGFMPFMFESYHFINDPPLPNVLLSGKYIHEYLEQLKFVEENMRTRLEFSIDHLSLECSRMKDHFEFEGRVTDPAIILEVTLADTKLKRHRRCIATRLPHTTTFPKSPSRLGSRPLANTCEHRRPMMSNGERSCYRSTYASSSPLLTATYY